MTILCLTPFVALADPNHCVLPNGPFDTDNRVDVYLHYQSFQDFIHDENGQLGGLTVDEVLGAMLQGMEQWNHSAAGREFRYMGTTSLVQGGCNYGVVRGGELVGGQIVSRNDGINNMSGVPCSGKGFTMDIAAKWGTTPIRWVTGDPQTVNPNVSGQHNRADLVGVFTHEFGHAVGIGHPATTDARGVMNNSTKRDLYQIDMTCAKEYRNGLRSLSTKEMAFTSGNTSTSTLVSSLQWSSAPGVTAGGGSGTPDRFRGTHMNVVGLYAEKYSSSTILLSSVNEQSPQPPIRIHRRELYPDYRDAIISQKRSADYYGEQEKEKFRQSIFLSHNGFELAGSTYQTDLRHCLYPGGSPLAHCSGSELVYSGHRVSAAFDTAVNRTVYAWTKQDRKDWSPTNNDLRISIGAYPGSQSNSAILGYGFTAGVRSDVAPAVACKEGQAGSSGYNCMVAYTDITDPKNTIRFKRFNPTSFSSYYYPNFESGHHQIDSAGWHRTASPIALFHHHGKWWVGFKLALATGLGGVRLYTSTTGNTGTWTLHSSTGYTATGATAIGDWMVSNRLRWAD